MEILIAAAKRYHFDRDYLRGYGKNPATWLNGENWLNEAQQPPQQPAAPTPAAPPLPPRNGYDRAKTFGKRTPA